MDWAEMTLGRRLAHRREQKGLKQVAVARRAGCVPGRISQLENDHPGNVNDELFARIAGAVGLTVEQLRTGEGIAEPVELEEELVSELIGMRNRIDAIVRRILEGRDNLRTGSDRSTLELEYGEDELCREYAGGEDNQVTLQPCLA